MSADEEKQEQVHPAVIEAPSALSHPGDVTPLSIANVSADASYPIVGHSTPILPSSTMPVQHYDATGLDLTLEKGAIYPFDDHRHHRYGLAGSVLLHLAFIGIVIFLAWFFGITSLRQLMAGPMVSMPPPQSMEVVLLTEDDIPPPPTEHPEFIIQKLKTLIPPPKPIIKPPPKPAPRPVVVHKVTKGPPNPSTRATASKGPVKLQVGSGNTPYPEYPAEALQGRIQGTVTFDITFNGSGGVASASIAQSSGSRILDDAARDTIVHDWHDASLANQSFHQQITFSLRGGVR